MERTLSAKALMKRIMDPHADLAVDLLRRVKKKSTGDPSYRYQMAGIIIFLAGVDKVLGLALKLLYLCNKVSWKWLKPRNPQAGVLTCGPGLTRKIGKLKELGLDLDELKWLVAMRNEYVHQCSIYAGYKISVTEKGKPRLTLRASGPQVTFSDSPPLLDLDGETIRKYASNLISYVGAFADGAGWQSRWRLLAKSIAKLPFDPWLDGQGNSHGSPEALDERVRKLNERYIGQGFSHLLAPAKASTER